jgi:predicted nuclease with TOPRIM domain
MANTAIEENTGIKSQMAISTVVAMVSSVQSRNKELDDEIRENEATIARLQKENAELEELRADNQKIIDHLSELLPR